MSPTTIPSITGGVIERYSGERTTFAVKSGQTVTGGRLVEISASFEVQHAGADSLKVAGVAMHSADPAGEVKKVSVAHVGIWNLRAGANIAAGDKVVAGAAGVVVPFNRAGGDTDDMIIGIAFEAFNNGADGAVQLRLGGGLS